MALQQKNRKIAKLDEELSSLWISALQEVEPGVVAFHSEEDKIVVWNIRAKSVKKYNMPDNMYLRGFVFE